MSCIYLVERESLLKLHKEEFQNAECQGRAHVLHRLPSLHKDQIEKVKINTNSSSSTIVLFPNLRII